MEFKKRVKQMLQEEGGRLKNVFKKGKERRKNKFIVLNFCPLLGHPPCGLQNLGPISNIVLALVVPPLSLSKYSTKNTQ